MRTNTRRIRRGATALLWLAGLLGPGLAHAQIQPARPTPIPPRPPAGSAVEIFADDSEIEPQIGQTFAGGQPATFERGVSAKIGSTPVAACVAVRLDPPPATVDATLSGSISPKQRSSCATGEVLTCADGEDPSSTQCGKFSVTIDSRPATPPATYRFDLIARCGFCRPIEKKFSDVQVAIARPGVSLMLQSTQPSPPVVPAGGMAAYTIVVQRKSYVGRIDVLPTVLDDPLRGVTVTTQPSMIGPTTNPNESHTVVVTASTQTGTAPRQYTIQVKPSLPQAVMNPALTAATATLTVDPAAAQPSLTVAVEKPTENSRRSTCAQYKVTVRYANFPPGFQVPATFDLIPSAPFDAGFTAVFQPITVDIVGSTGEDSTMLLVGVPADAATKRYDFQVRASVWVGSQLVTGMASTSLGVDGAPPRLTLMTSPATQTIPRGTSFAFLIQVHRGAVPNCTTGFGGNVELGTPGNPGSEVTGEFNPQPGTGNAAILSVSVPPTAAGGSYPFVIRKGNVPGNYEIVETTVTAIVLPPPQPPPPPPGGGTGNAPSITGFSPQSGAPGDRVIIQGTNFTNPSQVFFANNRPSLSVLFLGASSLNAEVPNGAVTGPIRVTTGAGSATSAQSFIVGGSPPPPPTGGLQVAPASLSFTAPQGGPAPPPQVLSIGSAAGSLNWAVTDNAAFVSATPASGVTPGATNVSVNVGGLAAGSYGATITVSAAGVAAITVPVSLTVTSVAGGTPVVNGFNPVSGGTDTQVEVIGANFTGVSQVQFNNTTASFQLGDSGRLFARVPMGATTGPIRVSNASGTGVSFTPFTVTAGGAPSIALFSPGSGRPGDRITIQGANFKDPSQVFFNGVASPFVLFAGSNFLSAEVPSGATSGPVRVTTSSGSATSSQSFVVTQ